MINPFKSKKGLGRGLSSLIGDNDAKTSSNKISISSIIPNKNQPRKSFDKEALLELTNSIKERGIIQPLIVRKSDDHDDKFLIEISKASGVMDWLSKLPNGFDYELSEGGKELSGGQKQTVALARALMRKPNYLLFDEPTANMDTGTEQQVLAGLKAHLTNETMLIVTHRMAPLSLVDRIIVLDNGRVAVDGPRDLVIQKLKTKKTA